MEMYLQKVISKKLVEKISFLLASWRSMTKIAGSGSSFISKRHGSVDPGPLQNVMDPEHCIQPWLQNQYSHHATPSNENWVFTLARKSWVSIRPGSRHPGPLPVVGAAAGRNTALKAQQSYKSVSIPVGLILNFKLFLADGCCLLEDGRHQN